MRFLEGNMNLDGVVILIILIMVGPALLLAIIGIGIRKKNKKAAKVFFILAVIYLVISFGICGGMMM